MLSRKAGLFFISKSVNGKNQDLGKINNRIVKPSKEEPP